ncbi:MAG: hypothetical protein CSA81_01230 [Acidobacteria bacterium]|nr:MAG: hypothetical protein CSA81_01230 [Acidobacteriota bacterium]
MTFRIDLRNAKGLHLSLGGGAARGLAHIGVLRVLEQEEIPIASICGSSMGAFVGGMFALYKQTDIILEAVRKYIASEHFASSTISSIPPSDEEGLTFRQKIKRGILLGKSIAFGQVIPFEEWAGAMYAMVPDAEFKDTAIPFYATGLDLSVKREVVFVEGSLRSAILASCSIPGVFPPVKEGGNVYVDGGWIDKVPVRPLIQFGAKEILAIDVSNKIEIVEDKTPGYTIILKSYAAIQKTLDQIQIELAPLKWKLPVDHIFWSSFDQVDSIVELGENYAREHIHEIRRLLKEQTPLRSIWARVKRANCVKLPPGAAPIQLRSIGVVEPL